MMIAPMLVNGTDMEKPGPDASMIEKARYLEEDFWDSFAEGIETDEEEDN
jgi:hypothetical protein